MEPTGSLENRRSKRILRGSDAFVVYRPINYDRSAVAVSAAS